MINRNKISDILLSHGERYHGGRVGEVAREWCDNNLSPSEVDAWCSVGVWNPEIARAFTIRHISPRTVRCDARRIKRHSPDQYPWSEPVYSLCNGDISFDQFVFLSVCF